MAISLTEIFENVEIWGNTLQHTISLSHALTHVHRSLPNSTVCPAPLQTTFTHFELNHKRNDENHEKLLILEGAWST